MKIDLVSYEYAAKGFVEELLDPTSVFQKDDAPIPNSGEETALSPMENVLASLAACRSYHVVSILRKKRQDFSAYSVEMVADRRDESLRVFTSIHLKYIIRGKNISKESVESALRLSEEYCSVGGMLEKAVKIASSYDIVRQ